MVGTRRFYVSSCSAPGKDLDTEQGPPEEALASPAGFEHEHETAAIAADRKGFVDRAPSRTSPTTEATSTLVPVGAVTMVDVERTLRAALAKATADGQWAEVARLAGALAALGANVAPIAEPVAPTPEDEDVALRVADVRPIKVASVTVARCVADGTSFQKTISPRTNRLTTGLPQETQRVLTDRF